MKKFLCFIIMFMLISLLFSCNSRPESGRQMDDAGISAGSEEVSGKEDSINTGEEMIFKIDGVVIPVIWEDNDTVSELREQVLTEDITVDMSMYGGNEQVGSLGREYIRNDKQMTAENGDIVLYDGDHIVVFYGSNSWSYTRLGKIDLSEREVTELIGSGAVTVSISKNQ